MKVFCIGDIVGRTGREMLFKELDSLVREKQIDIVIANAENAAHGKGINNNIYHDLMSLGIHAITLGNHAWGNKDVIGLMEYEDNIIRPANFDDGCPGEGSMIIKVGDWNIGVINLMGRTYMPLCNSPFTAIDGILENMKKKTNIIFVDFHAEATSEKIAMGWYLDGRVSGVFGTHTHVQTADESILTNGTGYITDVGMTGPIYSVLGMERKVIINRFLNGMPHKFEIAEGKGQLCGVVFDINSDTGKCQDIERIYIKEK